MTKKEIEQAETEARVAALEMGGLLVLLLGYRGARGRVLWDSRIARFRVDDRLVSMDTVRTQLSRIQKHFGKIVSEHTSRLILGEIELEEWQDRVRRDISSHHALSGALTTGLTSAAMSAAFVRAEIDKHHRYLGGFAGDIKRNRAGSAKNIFHRITTYDRGLHKTFINLELRVKKLIYTEAQRVRRAAESCVNCRALSGHWMPVGDMPAIGTQACGWNCKCFIIYR